MLKILINGYKGRLGKAICMLLDSDLYKSSAQICAGVDALVTSDVDSFPTYTDIKDCDMPADVIIDCSVASAVPDVINYALDNRTPLLICTTGLSEETFEKIDLASKEIPVFRSANMSLGINLLLKLIKTAVPILDGSGFDIEITERHHNQKIDSPSGTAFMLAREVNKVSGNKYNLVYGRTPENMKKRSRNELGIHSVRGGTITGQHTIIFAGTDEVIEISHSAYSKDVFAQGAIKAAEFLAYKEAGLYTMEDLVNSPMLEPRAHE